MQIFDDVFWGEKNKKIAIAFPNYFFYNFVLKKKKI